LEHATPPGRSLPGCASRPGVRGGRCNIVYFPAGTRTASGNPTHIHSTRTPDADDTAADRPCDRDLAVPDVHARRGGPGAAADDVTGRTGDAACVLRGAEPRRRLAALYGMVPGLGKGRATG